MQPLAEKVLPAFIYEPVGPDMTFMRYGHDEEEDNEFDDYAFEGPSSVPAPEHLRRLQLSALSNTAFNGAVLQGRLDKFDPLPVSRKARTRLPPNTARPGTQRNAQKEGARLAMTSKTPNRTSAPLHAYTSRAAPSEHRMPSIFTHPLAATLALPLSTSPRNSQSRFDFNTSASSSATRSLASNGDEGPTHDGEEEMRLRPSAPGELGQSPWGNLFAGKEQPLSLVPHVPSDAYKMVQVVPHAQTSEYNDWTAEVATAACQIFNAKCLDMHIIATQTRLTRFCGLVLDFCDSESISLAEAGIGPNAAREIALFLQEDHSRPDQRVEFHTLDLSKNFIGDEGASWIAELLGANDSITICDLRSNDFTAKGFDAIFAAVGKYNRCLTKLDLSGSSATGGNMYLGGDADIGGALRNLLGTNTTLQELNLSDTGLGITKGTTLAGLCEGLRTNSGLISLSIGRNQLGAPEVAEICAALKASDCSVLECLDLSDNSMGSAGAGMLASLLRERHVISWLDVSRNLIGVAGVALLTDALAANTVFECLVLDGNPLGVDRPLNSYTMEGKELAKYAAPSPLLMCMAEVDRWGLRDRFVSRNLGMSRALTTLSFVDCGLKDVFVKELVTVLVETKNESLTTLFLSGNLLGLHAAENIATLLKKSKTLKVLNVGFNGIPEEGGVVIAEAIFDNPTLQELHIEDNKIASRTVAVLVKCLRASESLSVCNIDNNLCDFPLFRSISDLVKQNRQKWSDGRLRRQRKQLAYMKTEQSRALTVGKQLEMKSRHMDSLAEVLEDLKGSVEVWNQEQLEETQDLEMEHSELSRERNSIEQYLAETTAHCRDVDEKWSQHIQQYKLQRVQESKYQQGAEEKLQQIESVLNDEEGVDELQRLHYLIREHTKRRQMLVDGLRDMDPQLQSFIDSSHQSSRRSSSTK